MPTPIECVPSVSRVCPDRAPGHPRLECVPVPPSLRGDPLAGAPTHCVPDTVPTVSRSTPLTRAQR